MANALGFSCSQLRRRTARTVATPRARCHVYRHTVKDDPFLAIEVEFHANVPLVLVVGLGHRLRGVLPSR